MFLFIMICLVLFFWVVSIFFNDIEDELQYRQGDSIFDWLPKTGWWSWYMQDPDDTWERKYEWNYDKMEHIHKKWHGIRIPAFVFDGWHGMKIIRQGFQYLTVFSGVVVGFLLLSSISLWSVFLGGLICFAILNHYSHNVWFFDGILLKQWWIDRGKEKIIKKFLDKHF